MTSVLRTPSLKTLIAKTDSAKKTGLIPPLYKDSIEETGVIAPLYKGSVKKHGINSPTLQGLH